MKNRRINILIFPIFFIGICASSLFAQADFATSLHATRAGKNYWYGAENGGFESLTNVPIEEMGCVECHGATNARGEENGADYEPSCADCHAADFSVQQSQCYSCHGRQALEAVKLGISDVHRDAGMVCWDCHTSGDLHGDGAEYNSLMEPGAIDAACENCHATEDNPLPAEHAGYNPHGDKLDCAACHAQTVISCYNCHLESQVEAHVKRARQPLKDFVILVNREKDGKVGTASFQSLTYEGNGFVAFGPYTPHTITVEGRTCTDCHVNMGGEVDAIQQYNENGEIQFASLNDDGTLSWTKGVIPMPADYQTTFKMEFITFNGDVATPAGEDNLNWSSIGKNTWDGHQMFFATPMTQEQMASLGFEQAIEEPVEPPAPAGPVLPRKQVVVAVTLTGADLAPLADATVEISRAVSGRMRSYEWTGTTDADGMAEVEIAVQSRTASGFYAVQVVDASGALLDAWNSIPLNGGQRVELSLQIDGAAEVTGKQPLAAAKAVPADFGLRGNFPNPFNSSTQIAYSIASPGETRLVLYNFLGQQVRVLAEGVHAPGLHHATWDGRDAQGRDLANGVYFCRLVHADGVQGSRLLLLK